MKQERAWALDQVDEGFDSVIMAGKNYFYKQYFSHITKEVLTDYHTIHQYLSKFQWEFTLPRATKYNTTFIKKIIFDILPLHDNHVHTVHNIDTKEEMLVSVPEKIQGENLSTYRGNCAMDEGDICYNIRDNIIQTLSIYFPYIVISSLSFQNIMVTKTKDDILYCTVTDLGDQIIPFVDEQKEMGVLKRIVDGKMKKRKNSKTIIRYKDSGKLVE